MKKIISFAVALGICLSLCACAGSQQPINPGTDQNLSGQPNPGSGSQQGVSGEVQNSSQQAAEPNQTSQGITREQAIDIALKDAGVSRDQVMALHTKQDTEDGRLVFDIEFYTSGNEYDYEISASDGRVLQKDFEVEDRWYNGASSPNAQSITRDQAAQIALQRIPGAGSQHLHILLEYDDGRALYEGDIVYQGREYDFEIDAKTGDVLSWEEEAAFD